ncbi:MAG TPA: DUF1428 domain-containing protein [Alphaproteobacteria bacterium]
MSEYVQGFVLPVPTKNLKAYKKLASVACQSWMDHGALDYRECVLEDDYKKDCKLPFSKLGKSKKGETIVFAWITYKNKADTKRIMKKVMADPRFDDMPKMMPFDMDRMTVGGFEPIVSSNDLKPKTKTKAKSKPKVKTAAKKKRAHT